MKCVVEIVFEQKTQLQSSGMAKGEECEVSHWLTVVLIKSLNFSGSQVPHLEIGR